MDGPRAFGHARFVRGADGKEFVKTHRIAPLVLFLLIAMAAAVSSRAQDKQPDLKTVHGTVVDKNDNPVPSSIVYLLNTKTQAIQTHIADDQANYSFSGLDPNVDYEIHAEHNDLTSSMRTLSSFDSRRDIEVVLKLLHKKTSK
jgi:hypothetical protein